MSNKYNVGMFEKGYKDSKKVPTKSGFEDIVENIGNAKGALREYVAECEDIAYEAALKGRTQFRDECLTQAVEAECVIDDLDFFVLVLKRYMATAKAFDALGEIPKIKKADLFLGSQLNIKKICKVMTKFMECMDTGKGQLATLHNQLKPTYTWSETYNKYRGETLQSTQQDIQNRFQKKLENLNRRAMMDTPVADTVPYTEEKLDKKTEEKTMDTFQGFMDDN
ncbi:MAG: hypothetical protein IJ489_09465 [Clostridia bacterium]|nr:hypothetical protein [Clostridia bacterium]